MPFPFCCHFNIGPSVFLLAAAAVTVTATTTTTTTTPMITEKAPKGVFSSLAPSLFSLLLLLLLA